MANFGNASRGLSSSYGTYAAAPLHLEKYVNIENAQISRQDHVTRPIGPLKSDVFEFEIPPQGNNVYLNVADLVIHGKAKVTKRDGTNLAATTNIAIINNFGQSWASAVEARINDLSMPGSSCTDAHMKAYIKTLTTRDFTQKNELENQLFYADTPGQFGSFVSLDNAGFKARKEVIANSREFDFVAAVNCDLLKSATFLGPGNKLSLKFYRANDEQLLMGITATDAKIEFTSLQLLYSKILTVDLPLPKVETHLIEHTELMRFPMPANTTNIVMKVQNGGRLPRAVYVFFVETAALNGNFAKNMLQMDNLKISSINLRVNGRSFPSEPLQPDFTNKLVARELNRLFQNIGTQRSGVASFFNKERFLDGYTLFPFDLTPDKCSGEHMHESCEGTLEVEARCNNMSDATTGFAYMIWDLEVAIDRTSGQPGRHALTYVGLPHP